jgi:NADH-quinone oxidoreductase subunit E
VVAATAAGAGATAAGLAAAKKAQSGASTSAVSVKPATAATSTPAPTAAASTVSAKSGSASTASSLASTGTTDTTGKVAGAKAVDSPATGKSLDSKASDLANGSTVKIVTTLGAAATGAVATAAAAAVTTSAAKVVEPSVAGAVKADAGTGGAGRDANLKMFTAAPKFGVRPELYNAPRGGKGDELSLIWGVAEKLEHKMNAAGIWHFDQIAHWTEANVEWFEHEFEGFKGRLSRDKWIEQCKKLAAGWRPEGHVGQRPKG